MHLLLLIVAAFVAGSINSVAGGGTLLTFPSLLAAHVSPVAANATSTVALVPGSLSAFWGYRRTQSSEHGHLVWFAIPSLLGGLAGAFLVVRSGDRVFSRLVPWLIFGAVALFVAQEPLRRWIVKRQPAGAMHSPPRVSRRMAAAGVQFLIAVYGGFFGAGMGILMLAIMGLLGLSDIHEMNRLKNISAVAINGVAGVAFALSGQVQWPLAAAMAVAAVAGGYLGAGAAQKIGHTWARRMVIVIGLGIGVYTLTRPL